MQVLLILLGITVTAYTLFPLIFAYPSDDRREGNPRNKRGLFDDITKIGKAVTNYGASILPDRALEHRFDINDYYFKDLERICRRLRGSPHRYDILCLENWGKSIIIDELGNYFGKEKPTRKPRTTHKPWPTVDIDVIFVIPTSTTPSPTTTETPTTPFDWPNFIKELFEIARNDMAEFGRNIKEEMSKLRERMDTSNLTNSVRETAQAVEKVGDGIENLNTEMKDVVAGIDNVSTQIDNSSKSIQTSIDNAGTSIANPLETGLTKAADAITSSGDSINTSVKEGGLGIEKSLDSGFKSVEEAIINNSSADLSTIDERLKEIGASVDNVAKTVETSVYNATGTIQTSLDKGAEAIQTSVNDASKEVATSINSSVVHIEKTLESGVESITQSIKVGAEGVGKVLDDGLKNVEIALKTGSDSITTAIKNIPGSFASPTHQVMMNVEQSVGKISHSLSLISQLIEEMPSEFQKSWDELPNEMVNAFDQSKIFKQLMEILEEIRKNTGSDLNRKRNILSMYVHRLAAGMLSNENSTAVGLKIKDIANEIGKIEMDKEDTLHNLGFQMEELGTALMGYDEVFPGIRTGRLFKSIGSLLKVLHKYKNNRRI